MIGKGTILPDLPPQSVATSTNSLESIAALEIIATAIFEVIRMTSNIAVAMISKAAIDSNELVEVATDWGGRSGKIVPLPIIKPSC